MIVANKQFQDPSINILITAKCKTLTEKSMLTYHVGRNSEGIIFLSIHSNTNDGFFSREYISLNDILAILEKQGAGNSFTSFLFHDLFEGRSSNSGGFLNAILLNEKVVRLEEGKKRKYVFNSASALLAKIDKAKARKTVKKAAVGKPSK